MGERTPLRFAELFAGAGGLSMGLERAGWSCAWHAELADAPRAILSHRWPEVPLYGDVTTLDGRALTVTHGAIDLRRVASESGPGWWDASGSVAPLRADPGGMPSHIAFGAQNSAAQGASAKCTPTLDKSKTPAVISFDWQKGNGDVTHALTHEGHDASEDGTGRGTPIVARMVAFGEYVEDDVASAIKARDFKDATDLVVGTVNTRTSRSVGAQDAEAGHIRADSGIPRRLTPRECERLMHWPDDHTLVPDAKGKPLSDAARYKACGNGVASVHSQWIGWRLRLALGVA